MKTKIAVLIFLIFFSFLNPSFAQTLDVFTDSDSYKKADIISLWGNVGISEPIEIIINDPDGKQVWSEKISPKNNGEYSTLIIAGMPDWLSTGTYTIISQQSDSSKEITIFYDSGETIIVEPTPEPEGGCLIATATYGTELAPQIQQLRELRDNRLLQTNSGTTFMSGFNAFYYSFAPTVSDWERHNPLFKEFVKITITPLISSLSILNYVDFDSESEIFGYGVGIIFMNIGFYFLMPIAIVLKLKKLKS